MYSLEICVGSSCHLKGSYAVINELKQLITEHALEEQLELKGCFCLGKCKDGVSLRMEGEIFTSVTIGNVREFFETNVVSKIRKRETLNGTN